MSCRSDVTLQFHVYSATADVTSYWLTYDATVVCRGYTVGAGGPGGRGASLDPAALLSEL